MIDELKVPPKINLELKSVQTPLSSAFSTEGEIQEYPLEDSERGQIVICLKQLIHYVDRWQGQMDLAHEFDKGYFRKLSTGEILQSFHDTGLEFPSEESKALLIGIFLDVSSKLKKDTILSLREKNLQFILEVKKRLLAHFLGEKLKFSDTMTSLLDEIEGEAKKLTGEQTIELIRKKMMEKLREQKARSVS